MLWRETRERERERGGKTLYVSMDKNSLNCLLLGVIRDNTCLGSPDVVGVLLDGAVTGELATLGYVVDHHGQPALPVLQGGGGGCKSNVNIHTLVIECDL